MQLKTTSVYVFWGRKLLLIKRSPNDTNLPGFWEAPAGHVDCVCPIGDSQTARREALRELLEETGLQMSSSHLRFLPQYSSNSHSTYLTRVHSKTSIPIRLSHEHTRYLWINPSRALQIQNLRPEVRQFLRDYTHG